jgi:hypothetical protein
VLSLKEHIEQLEHDLKANPMRISVFRDLPFAILRYDPAEEWKLRHEARLLAARLAAVGREVVTISFADLLWEALEECEGVDAVVRLEQRSGFPAAQAQITKYLSDPIWAPLPDLLARKLASLDPRRHVVFLTRTAAMAPHIYFMSMLLDQMKGRTEVTSILLYPGAREGENQLRFMNLPSRDALGTYRVKIYG